MLTLRKGVLGLNISLIYFRHFKVSCVGAYQISCLFSFNVSLTKIRDLVRNVSHDKIIEMERLPLSMLLPLSSWLRKLVKSSFSKLNSL